MPRIGPYSGSSSFAQIDGRSSDGRFLRRVRAELTEYVGGSPNAVQRTLIERIAMLRLRICAMEAKTPAGGEMGDLQTRTHLAWVGSLARLQRELGPPVTPKADRPRSLQDIAAGIAARKAAAK